MSALTLAAEIAADLRNRERRFALGYTDHDLTRPQIASYYRQQARCWRLAAARERAVLKNDAADRCEQNARECERRAKEYEK
jgi:hypothetical protein